MKKKILTAFILISLFILTLGVISASAETEWWLKFSVSNGEAEITGCDILAS